MRNLQVAAHVVAELVVRAILNAVLSTLRPFRPLVCAEQDDREPYVALPALQSRSWATHQPRPRTQSAETLTQLGGGLRGDFVDDQ